MNLAFSANEVYVIAFAIIFVTRDAPNETPVGKLPKFFVSKILVSIAPKTVKT